VLCGAPPDAKAFWRGLDSGKLLPYRIRAEKGIMPSASRPPEAGRFWDIATRETAAAKGIAPTVLVLMGVSGSGKSTVALELQRVLGWPFQEGDDLHPPENVEKMRAGQPLNDEDRLPWLEAVARWIDERLGAHEPGIITCSNLKRAYREITIDARRGVTLVCLRGDEPVIQERMLTRVHRYMPPSLLGSQFDTLEEPGEDEHPITVPVHGTIAETVIELLTRLASGQH
jgi:carbohydrate kinase (thermoresistant glucokinase family)